MKCGLGGQNASIYSPKLGILSDILFFFFVFLSGTLQTENKRLYLARRNLKASSQVGL